MNTVLERLKYHHFHLYLIALYSFFTHVIYKKDMYEVNNNVESRHLLITYSLTELNSKETKIFLDLQYKNMIHSSSLSTKVFLCTMDMEGKILGHQFSHDQKIVYSLNNTTITLNKKLLHSTLFGSIKLIRI
jgi:hypothetical protein